MAPTDQEHTVMSLSALPAFGALGDTHFKAERLCAHSPYHEPRTRGMCVKRKQQLSL